ncbi:CsgG/HfaB family protein [Chryseobacterium salivictor]|uniref:Curli production assembly/transport component CsgG n=1 Tax=Chryseobacterium salivictor TaxID=2547600 RepID=A0A4P6ZI26_9FLAO|nr:CsgG/HfaB family protein [Chryseobacterium salivictor]QBO59248.1 Curli production assembly/transport component CsgG [Chryseobacterium salivictor]
MKTLLTIKILLLLFLLGVMNSCGTMMNLPAEGDKSTLGEMTPYTKQLKELPAPEEKIVIGVYKFKDQTGQYKMAENGSNWSTAIPQGTTSILLKALEDSKWFRPIERENIGNLLNERQIIRSTRKEYEVATDGKTIISDQLPPLLYAGILLEGGIVSYDSNVMTGGIGARYFGVGGGTQYRQDRVTVYLRVVSSMTGEILKTIYTSKNILSTTVNGSFFRYIDTDRILEAEMGFTQNEPVSLAVTQAIEKAVYTLILESVEDGTFRIEKVHEKELKDLLQKYHAEKEQNTNQLVGNKFSDKERTRASILVMANGDYIKGDYTDAKMNIGGKAGFKYFFNDHVNAEVSVGYEKLENTGIVKHNFMYTDLNLEYLLLPKFSFSPYAYAGLGSMYHGKNFFKYQFGGGLEYLLGNNLAFRLNAQYDMGFDDTWDDFVNGKRKDQAFHIGIGINYYFDQAKKLNKKK